jgi:hypothetical protein
MNRLTARATAGEMKLIQFSKEPIYLLLPLVFLIAGSLFAAPLLYQPRPHSVPRETQPSASTSRTTSSDETKTLPISSLSSQEVNSGKVQTVSKPQPLIQRTPGVNPKLTPSAMVSMNRLENPKVGYALPYPSDWQVKGKVITTEFANGAQCESVEVVDAEPPPESGPAAFILHSFVQACSKLLTDGSTLDDFMRETYGDAFAARFQTTEVGGLRAYRTTTKGLDTTIFLQTNNYRIQIVASVKASPEKQSERISQVQEILDSSSFVKTLSDNQS